MQPGVSSPFREAASYGPRGPLPPVDTPYASSLLRMNSKGSPFAGSGSVPDGAFARAPSMLSAASGLQPLNSTDLGLPSIEEYTLGSPLRLAALQSAFAQGPPP